MSPDPSDKYLKLARGGPSMLVETQVVRSKSELLSVIQRITISQAVVYRNVDKKVWEQIAKGHQGATVVVVIVK
jgi:hypothetical protein